MLKDVQESQLLLKQYFLHNLLHTQNNQNILCEIMLELHTQKLIKLLLIKERFFEQPSSGGWRGKYSGCMASGLSRAP